MRRKTVYGRIAILTLLFVCLLWLSFPARSVKAESEQTIVTDENVVSDNELTYGTEAEGTSSEIRDLDTETSILSETSLSAQSGAQAVSVGDTAAYTIDPNSQADSGRSDSTTRRSYIYENEYGGVSLIDHVTHDDQKYLVVKEYDASHKLIKTQEIAYLLPIFGGFYAGDDANYVVFGQKNADLDDSVVVMTVAKYSKSWKLLTQKDLSAIYTWTPFYFGSCRMEETDDYLYLHTCHLMYSGHQANMFFKFSKSDLKVVNSYYYGSSTVTSNGYVSHSFNQFVKSDGEYVFRVDLGDTYPRGVMIIRNDVAGSFTSPKVGRAYGIGGSQGNNYTGVTLGGVELSEDNIIIAGNSVDQTNFSDKTSSNPYNIFVIVGDKAMTTATTIWLTDYEDRSEGAVGTPTLTALDNNRFLVMWQEVVDYSDLQTRLVIIDGDGNAQSDIETIQWEVSSCDPVFCSDGLVRWYATENGVTALYELNPYSPQPAVQSITLSSNALTMSVGETSSDLVATVLPADADQSLTWTSSKSSVATVDSNGTLTAKSSGTATITAKTSNGKTASCTVTVLPAVTSLTLNKSEISIERCQSQTLSATVLPKNADQTVTYSVTGNTTVASVDENGCVTGKKIGTTTVTATTRNGITATCQVTVTTPSATSVTLSQTQLTLDRKASSQLTAKVLPTDASQTVTWESSNESVATVSSGKITGVEAGKATITATTANGCKAICQVTVTIPEATSVLLPITISDTVYVNRTIQFSAAVRPSGADQTVSWSTSDSRIGTIDEDGLFTALSPGNVTVTATTPNGVRQSKELTVIYADATSVRLSWSGISLELGESYQLKATVYPTSAKQSVMWSTSDEKIVSVKEGKITGLQAGEATITATTDNGKTATCQVKVYTPTATSVSLNKSSATIVAGSSETLIATVYPTGADQTVTWTSSNTAVATISNGKITGVKAGSATITARTTNGKTATCSVTVSNAAATKVTLSQSSASLKIGNSTTLTATVSPSTASQTVTWTSSDTGVATVSNGKITAKSVGTATITAKSADGKASATCKVTVTYADAGTIVLSKTTLSLTKGSTSALTATVYPTTANQSVTWSSSNTSVATVLGGKITAVSAGSATITAKSADGKASAACKVTVTNPAATSISLNKSSTTIIAGSSETLIATIYPTAADQTVTWTSSNTAVATVSNGKVTGVKAGSATITAMTSNGLTARCSVTISNAAATKVTLSKSTASLTVGNSTTLTATVSPSTASQTVTWTSSDTGVATVSSGKITAKSVGTATITAKSADGKASATCKVTVTYADATSVTLSKTSLSLTKGNTSALTATVAPSNASQTITWSSSNTSVATVSGGKITAVSAGTATITAKSADGKASATCKVTVTNPDATSVSLNKSSTTIVAGASETLVTTVYPTGADQTVTWTSSNTAVATVSNGKVTGVKAGSATITAKTSNGKTATCSVTISNAAATKVTLSQSTVNLTIGNSTTLTAAVTPSAASQTVTWTSSDTGVATVSGGKITAKSVGTATITAKSSDGKVSATCKVTVTYADATGVTLSKKSLNLTKGNTSTLTATVTPSNANPSVTWSSSNTNVATVYGGKITAGAPGSATITAKTVNGKTATCKVTVSNADATSVTLNQTTLSLTKGNTSTLTATVSPSNADQSVTWTSSNTKVATVSGGKITAVAPGTAIITAKSMNGKTAVCTVTVSYATPTSVSLDKTSLSLIKGKTETLTATVSPSNANPTVSWSSSNTKVATVSGGKITAVTPGTTTVTAKTSNGKTATCKVTVTYAPSSSIDLSEVVLYLKKGQSATIIATVIPSTADQKVTWASSDPTVATVSSSGKVTALKAGRTVISATATDDGAMSTCPVLVSESSSSSSSSGSSGGSSSTETVPVYRLYSPLTGEHLYTTDRNEYETLWMFYGWGQEGIGWYSPTSGTPVYRLYNPGLKNHLYTTDVNEVNTLCSKYGWQKDNGGKPLFYSGGSQKIYRVYNKGLSGMHHLTTNLTEYNTLPKYGWQQEGAKLSAAALGQPYDKTSYFKS